MESIRRRIQQNEEEHRQLLAQELAMSAEVIEAKQAFVACLQELSRSV